MTMEINRRAAVGAILVAPIIIGAGISFAVAEEPATNPAEMMHRALARYGVEVLPVDTASMKGGMKLGSPPTHGGVWAQRHVDFDADGFNVEGSIEILAARLSCDFSRIRFFHLFVPSSACMDASRHIFADITLRDLSAYSPWMDDDGRIYDRTIRRIDALFVGDTRSA